MNNSTFLITSQTNRKFGTGFCIYKNKKGSFIVTCAHVVEDCGKDDLLIHGKRARLLSIGSSDDLDLALLYAEGLKKSTVLKIDGVLTAKDTPFEISGFKSYKNNYMLETLQGTIKKISQIYHNNNTLKIYELKINEEDTIEKGFSGSAVICKESKKVIAVATDRKTNGKYAYAIPVRNLKMLWEEISDELLTDDEEELREEKELQKELKKESFTQDVFDSLDEKPLLLFSTDSYNHTTLIDAIENEAIEIFGKECVIHINCRRLFAIKSSKEFFKKISDLMAFENEIFDSYEFQEEIVKIFENNDPLITFVLITGFEKLHENIRYLFAETLRGLHEEYSGLFRLIIFGEEKLVKLKYGDKDHSYFNTFYEKIIPPPSYYDWKKRYEYLNENIYKDIEYLTGGHSKLVEFCLKNGAKNAKECKKLIEESYLKTDLFKGYQKEKFCKLLKSDILGDFHPFCDDENLYRLYWDNLIVEERGKFVWRSNFIKELAKKVLKC